MNESRFWELVESSKADAHGDDDRQLSILRDRLAEFQPEEIISFDAMLDELRGRAYRWDLWAAAHIINAGCSDDGFEYFRMWLIAQGREVFEAALNDRGTLVDEIVMDPDWEASLEELLYVAGQAYRRNLGAEMPLRLYSPPELKGTPFDEDTPERLITELTPDVMFKGGDWKEDQIAGAAHVKAAGGEVRIISFVDGYSTTGLIEKMRNKLSGKMEIIITPLGKYASPYLHRIRKAEEIKFYPFNAENKTLSVEIGKAYPGAEMEIVSHQRPKSVAGVEHWEYSNNRIVFAIDGSKIIQFSF